MTTIRIVKNSDRCHVSVNGRPVATFLYDNYPENKFLNKEGHALHDAKAQCFITLSECREQKIKAIIDTVIVTK